MERAEALGQLLFGIVKRTTIFDWLIWILFVLWCVAESPEPVRNLKRLLRAADTLPFPDIIHAIASGLFPLVAAFGVSVLAARVLGWVDRKTRY